MDLQVNIWIFKTAMLADCACISSLTSASLLLQAYLTVAPFVAQYPEYRREMADHLLHAKLQHWDKSLRETAAQALAALVPTEPALFEGHFVDALLPLCLHPTLEVWINSAAFRP